MATRCVPLPDCWGLDTNAKISESRAQALAASKLPGGQAVQFVWRYVSLGPPSPSDITSDERDGILGAGLWLMLVQHAHLPGWVASQAQGKRDGDFAQEHAHSVAYPLGCSLAFDLEGCRSVGPAVIDHCTEWALAVADAGFSPVLYVGYATGLTPTALGHLPFRAYWSDFGQRSVQPQGFACKQHAQSALAGIPIDPDHASPDIVGNTLYAMAALDVSQHIETTDPAAHASGPAEGGGDPAA